MLPQRHRISRILGLALPIIGGMVSQNILNLVDTKMVGSLGNSALAAVGIGGFANFLGQAIILGISVGVQSMAARRKGEGNFSEMAHSLNGGLLIVLLVGVPLTLAYHFLVPQIYPFLNSDPEVIRQGVPYLQIRLMAIFFVGANFAFRGYWNAVDMSNIYMRTLIIMHASNIFLNYLLIYGKWGFPQLGVTGAAIGTAGSTVIGFVIYIFLGLRHARDHGFLKSVPSWQGLRSLIKVSLPSGIQQVFFSAGFVAMYWIIGMIGTPELAAANILINVMLVAILPGIAMGLASATLVGQALGRKDADDAHAWGWDVVKITAVGLMLIGAPMALFPEYIAGFFILDTITIELATWPMRLIAIIMPVEAVGLVLMNAVLGAGDSKKVMKISIFSQWLVFLPLAYLLVTWWQAGLLAVWLAQGGYRVLLAALFAREWQQRSWVKIRI